MIGEPIAWLTYLLIRYLKVMLWDLPMLPAQILHTKAGSARVVSILVRAFVITLLFDLCCYLLDKRQLPGGDPSRPGTANVGMSSFSELQGRQLLQPEAEYIFTHGNIILQYEIF